VSLHFFSVQLIPRFLKKRLRFLNHLAACINVTAQVMVRPLGVHKPCFPVVIHLRDPLAGKRRLRSCDAHPSSVRRKSRAHKPATQKTRSILFLARDLLVNHMDSLAVQRLWELSGAGDEKLLPSSPDKH
jgi:hypothetical protein